MRAWSEYYAKVDKRGEQCSESIDWPRSRPRRLRRFVIIFVVLAAIVIASRTTLSYYVDALWFGSLGYGGVFWKTLSLQWGIFAAFGAATFVILYGSFLALKRAHLPDLPSGHTITIGGQPVKLPVEPVLRGIGLIVSLAIAAVTAASMMLEWPTLALFLYSPTAAGGVIDPIFGKPLNFFLFALPAWQLVAGWLLTLAVMIFLLALLFFFITGGGRVLAGRLSRSVTLPWSGLSITLAFLLLTLGMRVYLSRFEQLLDDHTIFSGVTYTDAHVTLMGMLLVLRGARSRRVNRSGQLRTGGSRTLDSCGHPSSWSLLCRSSIDCVVRQQLPG